MQKENFGYRTTAMQTVENIDLTGKRAIVTGGYSGIGLETVRALASAGAQVTLACRDLPRAQATATSLNEEFNNTLINALALSLDSQESVKMFAHNFLESNKTLDILINNAAVMACPKDKTQEGFELQFGTNHLGHFALVHHLLPALIAAPGARVICLSSTGHFLSPVVFEDLNFDDREYDPVAVVRAGKTANALTAVGIQARFADQGIEAFAVHPGGIMTSLQRHMSNEDIQSRGWVDKDGNINERFKTPEQGASTSTWAATSAYLTGKGGQYLEDCSEAQIHNTMPKARTGVMHYAVDADQADHLWQVSMELLAPYL